MHEMEQTKRIILSFLSLLCATFIYAQSSEISGNVVDGTGEPIIGATVMEKGTSNGVVTDFDGNFTIKVEANATLVFTYIGFQTQELAAQDGMNREAIEKYLTEKIPLVNKELPGYSHIKRFEFMPEDFERTPKRSIKRFIYQRK